MGTIDDAYNFVGIAANGGVIDLDYFSGGARRVEVIIDNNDVGTFAYSIDTIVDSLYTYGDIIIRELPAYFIQQLEQSGTTAKNDGQVGGNVTRTVGTLTAGTNPSPASANNIAGALTSSAGSGFYTLQTSAFIAGANAAWAVEAWVFVNSTATAMTVYQENNASVSHLMQCLINTSGQLVFSCTNGVTSKNATSVGTINLGAWNHVVFYYAPPNISFVINGVAGALTNITAMPTFADANLVILGVNGATGSNFITQGAVYNSTSVPTPAGFAGHRALMLRDTSVFTVSQGNIPGLTGVQYAMGDGTGNALYPSFRVVVSPGGGQLGFVFVRMIGDD